MNMRSIYFDDIKVFVGKGNKKRQILNIVKPIEVLEGDVVGIIGENGSGKSTLINCILNEIPYKGEIKCGFSLNDIGIQFQDNPLNDLMKVKELIEIVLNKSINSTEAKNLISKFDLNNILNNRLNKISGGEKQRLVLALVTFFNKPLYIFDEITTGLDFEKRQEITNIIKNESKNKTILIVTHYFSEIENWANKILCLHKGKLIFFGETKQLLGKSKYKCFLSTKDSTLNNYNETNIIKKDEFSNILIGFCSKSELNDFIIKNSLESNSYLIEELNLETAYLCLIRGLSND